MLAEQDMNDGVDIQAELERQRMLDRQAASDTELEESAVDDDKRMGIFMFVFGLLLMLIQWGISILADYAAASVIALPVSILSWLLGAAISIALYFMTRPYRRSMGKVRKWWNFAVFFNALPILDSAPIDLIIWIVMFMKTRSKIVGKAVDTLK